MRALDEKGSLTLLSSKDRGGVQLCGYAEASSAVLKAVRNSRMLRGATHHLVSIACVLPAANSDMPTYNACCFRHRDCCTPWGQRKGLSGWEWGLQMRQRLQQWGLKIQQW